ncbi:hypothetical protein L873DRAFT_1815626 [Choiromyces venosus 120613-1]|uniref:Uncharacterized protein n=1 Tax=Choiromyces venosus 120613-1 TaxID=1336337 RepID=A0A3N4J636_9PEZI|nr:hypothetical protein L873DRAFT_1815626 [Choiromyces venosus 120613-1]
MFLFNLFILSLVTIVSTAALDFNLASDDLTLEQKAFLSDPLWASLVALSDAPGTTQADLEALTNKTYLDPRMYDRSTLNPTPDETLGVHCETSDASPMWLDIMVLISDFQSRGGGAVHWGPGCSEQGSYGTARAGTCAEWSYTTAWSLYAWRVWTIAVSCVQNNHAGGRYVFHREQESWPSDQRIY